MELDPNIQSTIPFLRVTDMDKSITFYVDGLGFTMTHHWMPDNKIEWCALTRGGGSLMLQRIGDGDIAPLGRGMSTVFICIDALAVYHELSTRGIPASEPFVGNHFWVINVADPDGYQIEFESQTDVPEGTQYSEWNPRFES